jgi:hypothetical protein
MPRFRPVLPADLVRYPEARRLPPPVQTELRQKVAAALETDPGVMRAVRVLAARQTEDERREERSRHENGRGVGRSHGRLVLVLAGQIEAQGTLDEHLRPLAKKLALRYSRTQLFELAAHRAGWV